jgi:hypothetical protein
MSHSQASSELLQHGVDNADTHPHRNRLRAWGNPHDHRPSKFAAELATHRDLSTASINPSLSLKALDRVGLRDRNADQHHGQQRNDH